MISISQQSDGTITIEGLNESDFMTLYMIAQTCFQQIKAKDELAEEAFNLGVLIEGFYHKQRGEQIKFLP